MDPYGATNVTKNKDTFGPVDICDCEFDQGLWVPTASQAQFSGEPGLLLNDFYSRKNLTKFHKQPFSNRADPTPRRYLQHLDTFLIVASVKGGVSGSSCH